MSAVLVPFELHDLQFRALRDADLQWVVQIETDAYVFPWTIGNFRDSLESGYNCLGVWVNHQPVGYAVVMMALDEAHLLNLAVASRWQGRLIGTTLLQHLIDSLRAARREMLYLEVRPSNIAGLRLYERFGFKQLGRRKDYYPAVVGREDALFLGLSLAPSLNQPDSR